MARRDLAVQEDPAVPQDLAALKYLVRSFRQIRYFDHTLQVSRSTGSAAKPLDDAAHRNSSGSLAMTAMRRAASR